MTRNIRKEIKIIILILEIIIALVLFLGYKSGQGFSSKEIQVIKPSLNKQESKTEVTVSGTTITCDSIVQGVRDVDLPNGNYTFVVTGTADGKTNQTVNYPVELINVYDDTTYTSNVSLGDTSTAKKMLVVKYHKNLTINPGVTVTATAVNNLTYKKGMYICVMGDLYNNGTITMTARGTYNQAGENVYLWKNMAWANEASKYEYVPASGAVGAASAALPRYVGRESQYRVGYAGGSGTARRTGGGGSGAAYGGWNSGPRNKIRNRRSRNIILRGSRFRRNPNSNTKSRISKNIRSRISGRSKWWICNNVKRWKLDLCSIWRSRKPKWRRCLGKK